MGLFIQKRFLGLPELPSIYKIAHKEWGMVDGVLITEKKSRSKRRRIETTIRHLRLYSFMHLYTPGCWLVSFVVFFCSSTYFSSVLFHGIPCYIARTTIWYSFIQYFNPSCLCVNAFGNSLYDFFPEYKIGTKMCRVPFFSFFSLIYPLLWFRQRMCIVWNGCDYIELLV